MSILDKEILLLLNEAESLRTQLAAYIFSNSTVTTAAPSPDISMTAVNLPTILKTERISSDISLNMDSPASTIYLRSGRSRSGSLNRSSTQTVSPELTRLLPTIPSITHRRALLAVEKFGISNVRWKKGFTALHWAAQSGRRDVYQYLLNRGADPLRKDEAGVSAQSLLGGSSEESIPANLPPQLEKAARAVQQVGWDKVKWGGEWTMLHWAYQHGREDVKQFCLQHGANVNACDDKGLTPAHYA